MNFTPLLSMPRPALMAAIPLRVLFVLVTVASTCQAARVELMGTQC